MKRTILNFTLSTLLVIGCASFTFKKVEPVIPKQISHGFASLNLLLGDTIPFYDSETLCEILKAAECKETRFFKLGTVSEMICIESELGKITYCLVYRKERKGARIYDLDNKLTYHISNQEHIQWVIDMIQLIDEKLDAEGLLKNGDKSIIEK